MNGLLLVSLFCMGMFLGAVLSTPLHHAAFSLTTMANGPDEEVYRDDFEASVYRN